MDPIKEEILKANYYEHLKAVNELARFLPEGHSRRLEITKSSNDIVNQLK